MFPIAALLEVGNVNLSRVELIWSPITTHLSEVRGGGNEREKEREWEWGERRERGKERQRERYFSTVSSCRPVQLGLLH
jgi:hypothetical protein